MREAIAQPPAKYRNRNTTTPSKICNLNVIA